MLNQGFIQDAVIYRYRLQPGDGTNYEFSIIFYDKTHSTSVLTDHNFEIDTSSINYGVEYVISGINKRDYVTLVLHNPGDGVLNIETGSYEFRKYSLRNIDAGLFGYAVGHLSRNPLNPHTVAVLLLAASVLIDDPLDIIGALKKIKAEKDILLAHAFVED
jgi:hypothetical protein